MALNIPDGLKFTKEHEWVKVLEDDLVLVGITSFAQEALGDIVYVEVPAVGDELESGAEFGVVESVKAVSDLYAPLTGEVVEVNEKLDDEPDLVNSSPYEQGWILKLRMSDATQLSDLLDQDGYREVLES